MAGQYHRNTNIFTAYQKDKISKWVIYSIKGNGWEEDIDLHIDEIIEDDVPIESWIDISLLTVEFANQEIIRLGFDNIIPIMFVPLYGDEHEKGVNFENLYKIEKELDITPPSLFVCPDNWRQFRDMFLRRKLLYDILYEESLYSIYYYEELHPNGLEYIRNISILPKKRIKILQDNGWTIP